MLIKWKAKSQIVKGVGRMVTGEIRELPEDLGMFHVKHGNAERHKPKTQAVKDPPQAEEKEE